MEFRSRSIAIALRTAGVGVAVGFAAAPAWAAYVGEHRGKIGERFTIECAAGSYPQGSVWGTGVYTDDSEVCTAAVHDGRIDPDRGGTVTVEIRLGEPGYEGTEQRGVTSGGWGAWQGSFVFVSPPREDQPTPDCDQPLFNSMNTAACEEPTDTSPFTLEADTEVTRIGIWTDTRLAGSTLSYQVYDDQGRAVQAGTLEQGDCDPYQTHWCLMEARADMDLAAGNYALQVSQASTCQNTESNNDGFVVVFGCVRGGQPAR